jgi:hypothetical protein
MGRLGHEDVCADAGVQRQPANTVAKSAADTLRIIEFFMFEFFIIFYKCKQMQLKD